MRISLLAGETKAVSVGGGRFYYESGSGKITVKTLGNEATEFSLKPGMGFQNRDEQLNFSSIEIKNEEIFDMDIDFIISYREVFDNRVTFGTGVDASQILGNVGVFNSQRLVTEAFKAYMGYSAIGAIAANYGYVSLRLPALTGKKIAVQKIAVSGASAHELILLRSLNTTVTQGTAGISNLNVGASGGYSKFVSPQGGIPASVARLDSWVSSVGGTLSSTAIIGRASKPAGVSHVFKFDDPIILGTSGVIPTGIIVGTETINAHLSATFEYQEY